MKTLLALALFMSHAHAGDVLFIDLNNSSKEIKACRQGVKDANEPGQSDDVFVVGEGKPVDAASVEKYIAAKEAEGHSFDTVVISGHDGSGHFFGENGRFLASEMTGIVERHPKLKESMSGMALWGCYTANGNACENYWMKSISPNLKATLGFTLQSPDNRQPGNWDLLQDYCTKRKKIAEAVGEAEINEIFFGLKGINHWNAGLCVKDGVCSQDYSRVGEKKATCLHTYKELYDRCSKFDPSKKLLQTFQNYYSAHGERYKNPPPDGENEYTSMGIDRKKDPVKGDLRRYYNQLHLWYMCSGLLQKETGYEMPEPASVIRLTKFETLKNNFADLHQAELKQYNDRLHALGWDDLILEPKRQSREEIVDATSQAVARFTKLSYSGNKDVNGVTPYKMLIMAYGFDNSLRSLEPSCTPFSYVHEGSNRHSDCVTSYGYFPKWPPRK